MLRRLLALLAITIGLIATLVPTSTTTASASAFTYDAPAVARADVHEFGRTDARTAQVTSVWERSASPPMEARGTVTTLVTLSNATNTADDVLEAVAPRVTFGHGARHLEGTGLSATQVESTILQRVTAEAWQATTTGSFWGRVQINGTTIEYRAYTLPDGTINVGTYYVP